ncbi:unnamed protein product [Polarella glacialis]|uniref:Uncharacterized protein n=1 Tax=Polarella glacialis TaxID=89957 RepID=A0A813IMN8_POLGL|nr:unnamed protein product [Polarella glacialis]
MLGLKPCGPRWAGLLRAASSVSRPMSEVPGPTHWPLLGSLPDFLKRSGKLENPDMEAIHLSYYREFGNIYRLDLPVLGRHVVICDPREYLKVFQMEGKYPSGASQLAWPFMHYYKAAGNHTQVAIMSDGEPWREVRHQLAKDIFGPPAAKEYLPAITEAAKLASQCAAEYGDRFDDFVTRLSFDMFCALAVGKQPQTTNEKLADPADLQFVKDSIQGFSMAGQLMKEPYRKWFPGGKMANFMASMGAVQRRGTEVANELLDKLEAGQVEGLAANSYMAKLKRRGELSKEEIRDTLMALLAAGVDTTSVVLSWILLNLAQHPDKQQRLRDELSSVLQGGDLVEDAIGKLPYLKACIRESHRFTPSVLFGGPRKLPQTATFSGFEVPAGTLVLLNQTAFQRDPRLSPIQTFSLLSVGCPTRSPSAAPRVETRPSLTTGSSLRRLARARACAWERASPRWSSRRRPAGWCRTSAWSWRRGRPGA